MVFEIRFEEDLLVLRDWMISVLFWHCRDILETKPKIDTHIYMPNKREIDVVINCKGKRICIELKRMDIFKAVDQAIGYLESDYCDVAYIALNWDVDVIIDFFRRNLELAKKVFEHGIGVISARNNIIVFRAFEKTSASRKFLNLLELIRQGGSDGGEHEQG